MGWEGMSHTYSTSAASACPRASYSRGNHYGEGRGEREGRVGDGEGVGRGQR